MQKKYIECGKIVSTHGIRGELRVQPWCDSADFLCNFEVVYLGKELVKTQVMSARSHKNMVLLTLAEVDTLEKAVALRERIVYIDREDAPPAEEGTFYIQDLIGLTVTDADSGKIWGRLTDVFSTGANDVYEITGDDSVKRLIPAIRDIIMETNLETGIMKIRPIEGLFDEN